MKLFISYSRKDQPFARQLVTDLRQMGFEVWIDLADIPVGTKWSSAVQQGLDSAHAMILIISPDAMASSNVEDEWQYFLDEKKLIIPVLLKPTKTHFQLHRLQYVDFHELAYQVAFRDLCAQLIAKSVSIPEVPSTYSARTITLPTTQPIRPSVVDLMPPPFSWVQIPSRSIKPTLHADASEDLISSVPTFQITRNSVTNVQFGKFIEANGYSHSEWWTQHGWEEKIKHNWSGPRNRKEEQPNSSDEAINGISWHEAAAFCLWLTDVTGEQISLPSMPQWIRADECDTEWEFYDLERLNLDICEHPAGNDVVTCGFRLVRADYHR